MAKAIKPFMTEYEVFAAGDEVPADLRGARSFSHWQDQGFIEKPATPALPLGEALTPDPDAPSQPASPPATPPVETPPG